MTPAQILRGAADLLSKPGAWAQYHFALNAAGVPTLSWGTDAVCWCMRGAIKAAARGNNEARIEAEYAVAKQLGFFHLEKVADWNDAEGRTQAEVVAKLIEAAETQEKAP
jgi:hypothetical protein